MEPLALLFAFLAALVRSRTRLALEHLALRPNKSNGSPRGRFRFPRTGPNSSIGPKPPKNCRCYDIASSARLFRRGDSVIYAATKDRPESHLHKISVVGTGGKQLTRDAGTFDRHPTYSRDGAKVAFARAHRHRPYSMGGWTWDDWDIYVMDADGGNVGRLSTNKYYGIGGGEFSPDGKKIFSPRRPTALGRT
jgi:Tol biopolymer transport system component